MRSHKLRFMVLALLATLLLAACSAQPMFVPAPATEPVATPGSALAPTAEPATTPTDLPETGAPQPFYFGVDLSYVNEMDDCGAVYRENGESRDAFELFADHGATMVRAPATESASSAPMEDSRPGASRFRATSPRCRCWWGVSRTVVMEPGPPCSPSCWPRRRVPR